MVDTFLAFLEIMSGVKNEPFPIEWCNLGLKKSYYSSSTHAEMKKIISFFHRKKRNIGIKKYHSSIYYNNAKTIKFPKIMVVISLYKGKLRYSRPCTMCIIIMKIYGIKKVIYSSGDINNPYYIENVVDMPFITNSRGNR